jgi:uncharacterized protein YecE (DUF72 family)
MAIWIGTSGYNYPEWKGSFYPPRIVSAKMLPYYAERFPTVEINNTFYRMPTEKAVSGWSEATPADFRLTLKVPKQITHIKRLKNCSDELKYFLGVAATLGPKRGALLFQLPPFMKKDTLLLAAFLAELPMDSGAAFEFRHPSWFDDEVYEVLRARSAALCIADSEKLSTPVEITARHAYFRLRDEGYTPADIARWGEVIVEKTAGLADVFVYFKHEEEGKGAEFGKLLMQKLRETNPGSLPTQG